MVLHESAEDYLESILILQEQCGSVRSIDIVNKLGYSKPSVSIAMRSCGRRRRQGSCGTANQVRPPNSNPPHHHKL